MAHQHHENTYNDVNNDNLHLSNLKMDPSNAGTGTTAAADTTFTSADARSASNSTHTAHTSRSRTSRGSGVLQRAREYNKMLDENRSRSKSFEREQARSSSQPRGGGNGSGNEGDSQSQRERAMASVQNESSSSSKRSSRGGNTGNGNSSGNANSHDVGASNTNRYRSSPTPSQKSSSRYKNSPPRRNTSSHERNVSSGKGNGNDNDNRPSPSSLTRTRSSSGRSTHAKQPQSQQQQPKEEQAIVTPELLVDALSGHEDGLLAIAERLMEHYDTGYDAMGEAIIDAFADVQKLFQHVVEAAHMEGAAYEAGRKEEEIEKLKRALGGEGDEFGGMGMGMGVNGNGNGRDRHSSGHGHKDLNGIGNGTHGHGGGGHGGLHNGAGMPNEGPTSPQRHDEFIDQDVRDVLLEAIRKGQGMKDSNKHAECFQIFEMACNSASALLPVDSDHRGRLQLSIARAESMSPERACAILRYVMDDVLRSGLNSNSKVIMPDPSKRGDCVLDRPEASGARFSSGQGLSVSADESGVLQSSEEALASLVEEMKEILSAPVYDNSPLQNVAKRFWDALSNAQRSNLKNEERLEQKLATLKAEFLLAREEWEDKYNVLSHKHQNNKKKLERMKQSKYMEQARGNLPSLGAEFIDDSDDEDDFSHPESPMSTQDSPRPTNVSGSSSFVSLSQQAKSIVGSFGCNGRKNKGGSRRDTSPPSAASTYASRKTMSSGRR